MEMTDSNSYNIIEKFCSGEAEAARSLFDMFYRPLCYYAESIVRQRQEAEDIVVESFLKLLRKREDFVHTGEIKSFLYTATRNACIDYLRKRKRQLQSETEIKYLSQQTSAAEDILLINAEVMATLFQEVEKLPPQCAEVFKLMFFQQLTTDQVAKQLSITTKTVLNQKGRAIQLLRKSFLQQGMLTALGIMLVLQESPSLWSIK